MPTYVCPPFDKCLYMTHPTICSHYNSQAAKFTPPTDFGGNIYRKGSVSCPSLTICRRRLQAMIRQ
uniref:Uncharacterized protein n=1 Tax=Rhizophora mucronata TaxID=61149 RepID=A0A2P2N6K4_RHIMU